MLRAYYALIDLRRLGKAIQRGLDGFRRERLNQEG
jgi:hypothetical protein